MVQWTLNEKDGWHYSQDGVRRWMKRPDGSIAEEMVPQGPTLTDQSFIKDCDVNEILKKILKTGQMPANFGITGVYGDFSEIQDYQESLHTIQRAQELFMDLPHEIRTRFGNDPQQLIEYLNDPNMIEDSIKLGLREVKDSRSAELQELQELNKNLSAQAEKPKSKDEKTKHQA